MNENAFKLNYEEFSEIYFASDFHYNHQKEFIWIPRGYKTAKEHDEFLEHQCDFLPKDALLIYLGDFSLNSTDENTIKLLERIKCPKFYIFGNHESNVKRLYKQALAKIFAMQATVDLKKISLFPLASDFKNNNFVGYSTKSNGTTFFGYEATFRIQHKNLFCRHMAPLIWDEMKKENNWAMCGHSHGSCPQINPTEQKGKILDVGVDNALKHNNSAFFTFKDICQIMNKKYIKTIDHHREEKE